MERIVKKSSSFVEADAWDIEQYIQMQPEEREMIAELLRLKVFGKDLPDVRESERLRLQSK